MSNASANSRRVATPSKTPFSYSRAMTIARTDLLQLAQSRDFWIPLAVLALIFFILFPAIIIQAALHSENSKIVDELSKVLGPSQNTVVTVLKGSTPQARAGYSLGVSAFAPLAVIVPLTISSAVGANTFVGERERGSGEFLAHSPAQMSEIYLGKLIASLVPGYLATALGFTGYSLVVNMLVGPHVGGWFFPTPNWWVMVCWVVPPFIALGLALILALSARVTSAAAAQQASSFISLPLILVSYGVSTGERFQSVSSVWITGAIFWVLAIGALFYCQRFITRDRLLGTGG